MIRVSNQRTNSIRKKEEEEAKTEKEVEFGPCRTFCFVYNGIERVS